MKDNIDKFLNRLLYSLYNLMYFSGLPIYVAVELLVQRPLYCLPFWKRRLKEKYGIVTRFPTFMLFDKNGKLVSSDAPFPQHLDALINEINKCLE